MGHPVFGGWVEENWQLQLQPQLQLQQQQQLRGSFAAFRMTEGRGGMKGRGEIGGTR
jgi:hypothetical protein